MKIVPYEGFLSSSSCGCFACRHFNEQRDQYGQKLIQDFKIEQKIFSKKFKNLCSDVDLDVDRICPHLILPVRPSPSPSPGPGAEKEKSDHLTCDHLTYLFYVTGGLERGVIFCS